MQKKRRGAKELSTEQLAARAAASRSAELIASQRLALGVDVDEVVDDSTVARPSVEWIPIKPETLPTYEDVFLVTNLHEQYPHVSASFFTTLKVGGVWCDAMTEEPLPWQPTHYAVAPALPEASS